jgi:outer membrane protein
MLDPSALPRVCDPARAAAWVFMGCVVLAALTVPAATRAADLLEIHQLARDNDAQFAAARSAWQAAQERLPQARALLLPAVTLSANTNINQTDTTFSGTTNPFLIGGNRRFNTNALNVQVVQPLLRQANRIQVEQANLQLQQAQLQLQLAGQELTLRAAQAFFDVLAAQDTLGVIEAQKAAIAEQLAQAKANFQIGTATIVDFNEARARFDLVGSQEITTTAELELRRRALQQIIGREAPRLRGVADAAQVAPPVPLDMQAWVDRATGNALSVLVQQAALEIAQRDIDRQRAGHWPTIDAIGSAGQNRAAGSATSPIGTDITQYVLGLQLSVPLYQGGATSSRVREAVANRERSLNEVENARRAAALAARQAYLGVTSGISQVRALEAALESSRVSLQSTQTGLKVGVRTQVDVLNAQQLFFGARRDLAIARYQALLATLRLQAAIGDLQEDDLVPVNALLRASAP